MTSLTTDSDVRAHLGRVADLRVVDVHGGADPAGQREGGVLLVLTRRRGSSAGIQLPLQHHRLGVDHLRRKQETGSCQSCDETNRLQRREALTFARTTSEAAADQFPSHGCSLLGSESGRLPSLHHQPTESTETDTLFVSAPSMFHATQVYTPENSSQSENKSASCCL